MVLKASGMSTVLPSRSTTARLVRIKLVVFLVKMFFTFKTVTTVVLPIIPMTANKIIKIPRKILTEVDIPFTMWPFSS